MEFPLASRQVGPKFVSVGREDFSPEIAIANARSDTIDATMKFVGGVVSPLIKGEIDARISAAMAKAEGELQKTYRELEKDPDYETYEERFKEAADQLKTELSATLKLPGAKKSFEDRYEQLRGKYNKSVVDLWSVRSLSFRYQAYEAEQENNASRGDDEAIQQTAMTYVGNGTLDPTKAAESVAAYRKKSHYVKLKGLAATSGYQEVIDKLIKGELDEEYALKPGEAVEVANSLLNEYKIVKALDLERRDQIQAETYLKAVADLNTDAVTDPQMFWNTELYPELSSDQRHNLESLWNNRYVAQAKADKNAYLAEAEAKLFNGTFDEQALTDLISRYPEEADSYRKKLETLRGGDAHDRDEAQWDMYLSAFWRTNSLTQAHLDQLAAAHPDMVTEWTSRFRQQEEDKKADRERLTEETGQGYRTSFYAMLWDPNFSYDYLRKWLVNNHGPGKDAKGNAISRIGTKDFDSFMADLENIKKKQLPAGAAYVYDWVKGFFKKKIDTADAARDPKKLADMEGKQSAVLEALAATIRSGQFDPKLTLEKVQKLCDDIDQEIVRRGVAGLYRALEAGPLKKPNVFELMGQTAEGIRIENVPTPTFTPVEGVVGGAWTGRPLQPRYAELKANESLIRWTPPTGPAQVFILNEKTGEIFDAYTHKPRTDIRIKK